MTYSHERAAFPRVCRRVLQGQHWNVDDGVHVLSDGGGRPARRPLGVVPHRLLLLRDADAGEQQWGERQRVTSKERPRITCVCLLSSLFIPTCRRCLQSNPSFPIKSVSVTQAGGVTTMVSVRSVADPTYPISLTGTTPMIWATGGSNDWYQHYYFGVCCITSRLVPV